MDGKHRFRKLFVRLVFFALLGWAVALVRGPTEAGLGRVVGRRRRVDAEAGAARAQVGRAEAGSTRPVPRSSSRRASGSSSFFAAATFTAGAGDLISKALDPARCAALMQTTGEDESICAAVEQEEAFSGAEEAAAAQPEAAPEAAPAEEPLAESQTLDAKQRLRRWTPRPREPRAWTASAEAAPSRHRRRRTRARRREVDEPYSRAGDAGDEAGEGREQALGRPSREGAQTLVVEHEGGPRRSG